jgi:protein O-mannosyl-transferase
MSSRVTKPAVEQVVQETKTSWWQWILPPSILSMIGFLTYYPSINYPFQFDDIANITKCYHIRHETFFSMFFKNPRWIATWLNAANFRMGKGDPLHPHYYRLLNISIHLITASLVFFFIFYALRQLKSKIGMRAWFYERAFVIALFTATLFLLHPVQSQTVSYVIQGRLEGLAGLLSLALILMVLGISTTQNLFIKGLLVPLLIVTCAFVTGTKEMAIMSPFLALLTDWFFVAQGSFESLKKRWWLHAIVFTVIMGFYLYYFKPQFFLDLLQLKRELGNNIGNEITESRTDPIKPLHFMISEFKVILHYLWIFVWPFGISVDYDWKMVRSFFSADCFIPFMILVSIAVFILRKLKTDRAHVGVFGLLWFFITIAPRASFIPSTELMADYKTYLASLGWLFTLAFVGVYALEKLINHLQKEKRSAFHPSYATLGLALILAFGTYQRNKVWSSGESFWSNILSNAPGRARAYNNYGVALSEAGKHTEAIPHFKKAIKMDTIYPDPLNNLAVAYSAVGNLDEAIDVLKKGLQIQASYPEAYNNLASFMIQKKDFNNAENMLKISLQLRPWYGKAHFNMGRLYTERANEEQNAALKQQHLETAWKAFKDAVTIGDFDNNIIGYNEYARLSNMLKRYDDSIFAYSKMLTLNPNLNEAYFFLGNAYYFKQDITNAQAAYAQFAQRCPNDMRGWNNLAETYFMQKKYADSLACFQKTVALDSNALNPKLRMAECLANLNKVREAKFLLESLDKHPGIPDNIRANIKVAIAQLSQPKGTRKA